MSDQEGVVLPSTDRDNVETPQPLVLNPEGANMETMMEPKLPDLNELSRNRSRRQVKPTEKVVETSDRMIEKMFGLVSNIDSKNAFHPRSINAFVAHLHGINELFDETLNVCHYYAYNAVAATNDVYTLKQMLKLKDISPFVHAMIKEVNDHEKRNHWEVVKRRDMPAGSKTILSVWAFKVKRYPDSTVLKHKARLNAYGGMQRWGVDYWQTYADVVNWISVRFLLAITIIHGLK